VSIKTIQPFFKDGAWWIHPNGDKRKKPLGPFFHKQYARVTEAKISGHTPSGLGNYVYY
jgi:hypothetical protein